MGAAEEVAESVVIPCHLGQRSLRHHNLASLQIRHSTVLGFIPFPEQTATLPLLALFLFRRQEMHLLSHIQMQRFLFMIPALVRR